jgi:hypothetical protein
MAIPLSGRFNYFGIVPDDHVQASSRWQLHDVSGAAAAVDGAPLVRNRLVGLDPSLEIADIGITPDVGLSPYTGRVPPKVLLSRLTLRAASADRASVAEFSFCVDQAFVRSWHSGDVLHVARTGNGGLGVSILRGERLIAAIGAVTAVPHGEFVSVRFPRDAIREAKEVFCRVDPEFDFPHLPIEVQVESQRRVMYAGRLRMGSYEVFVEHGSYRGLPGVAECVAICFVETRPSDTSAICSAQLLEHQELSRLVKW